MATLGGPTVPLHAAGLAKPLVGAIAAYFLVNTGLVAGAIAATTSRSFLRVWRDDFLWSGASFMVAGSAGAMAAVRGLTADCLFNGQSPQFFAFIKHLAREADSAVRGLR